MINETHYQTNKGYMIKLGSEIVGLGGDEQFVKSEASGKIY